MKKIILLCLVILLATICKAQTKGSSCDSLVSKASDFYLQKNFKEAIPLLEKALLVCSKDTGMTDYDYYAMLAITSISYYETGNEDSALITGESAAKFFEKIKAYDDQLYNTMLGRMGAAYVYFGEYQNAVNVFEKCIPFFEKKFGSTHVVTLEYSLELATSYSGLNDFKRSALLNRRLYQLILSSLGKNNPQFVSVLTNMGNDFMLLGMYDSAAIYHSESLALREKLMGRSHPEYAKGCANMAQLYNDQGRYGDAIRYFEEAKEVYEKGGYLVTNEYATLLNNIAGCYQNLGNPKKAYEHLEQSLRIKRRLFGNYHFDVAAGVNTVGSILEDMFDYTQALEAYRHSKYILEIVKGTETILYANVLNNLGSCMESVNKYDSSIYYLKVSLALKEKIYGAGHLNIANTLNNIASVLSGTKKYDEAEAYYKRSAAIIKKNYGTGALQLSTVNQNMALLQKSKGNYRKADSLFNASYNISSRFILNNTEGLSEKDKETFAEGIRLNQYTALSLRTEKTLKNDWIYNSSLFYKGLLLEGSKGLVAAFRNIRDTVLKRKADEYLSLKRYIGVQLLKPEAGRPEDLSQTMNRTAILERSLLQASAGFRNWKDQFAISWKNIQKKLGKNEIAIEFLAYYPLGISTLDSTLYAAMVLKPGISDPVIVPLFYEAALNKLITSTSSESVIKKLYRSTIRSSSSKPTAADSLYHIIWKPLLAYVAGAKNIYFAADGVLNNLNLAAIITPEGKRLIEEYEFIQLGSTRNMMKPSVTLSFKNIQLWGGIQYGNSAASSVFSYLPGTLTEAEDIAAISLPGTNTKIITGTAASEHEFKQLDGRSPEVIHVASHGFFFPDPSSAAKQDDNRFAMAVNPLLRSGLALANANDYWTNGPAGTNKEDGILTAYEIADMDLTNTKLIVLSACETGLGDIKSGEGVYGLQRAFKLAGVQYLIMSLWQVPDLETKEFMQLFYSKCFSGIPIRKAFRETQLEMNKKYQPYQWAAFVLVE